MFQLKDNAEIGFYFSKLVEKKYKHMRQFGKAYLELLDLPSEESDLKNMSNRLTQIKEGKKSIQLKDLPVFTHLLGVSCEELLSAGEYIVPYMTVRQFAASHDPNDWEAFLQQADTPFLNCDEFGRNAIDYALAFKNYELLHYLMDQKYICFVDPDPNTYVRNFCAGTKIKRRKPEEIDALCYDLKDPCKDADRLRRQMICLALEHEDFPMLDKLKAREIPTFYSIFAYNPTNADPDAFRDDHMIDLIAGAKDPVIDYFSQEFSIREPVGAKRINTYLFPYLGRVAALLVQKKSPYAETVLNRCAEHNLRFLQQLQDAIQDEADVMEQAGWIVDKENPCQQVLKEFTFFQTDEGLVSWYTHTKKSAVTNLISVNCESHDIHLASLIDDVNSIYQQIMTIVETHR